MNPFEIQKNDQNKVKDEKILFHSKNYNFDNYYLEMENKNLTMERVKSKTSQKYTSGTEISPKKFQTLKSSSSYNLRDPAILDDIVISKLKSETLNSFLTSYGIQASSLASISRLTGHIVYSFKVYNCKTTFSWTIRKTITEFGKLFRLFRVFLKKEKLNNNIKTKSLTFTMSDGSKKTLDFDYNHCKKIEEAKPEEILSYLDQFLNNLLDIPCVKGFIEVFDFLELSCIYYPPNTRKYKECYLKKKSGGRFRQGFCTTVFKSIFSIWLTRWFLISEDGIKYCVGPTKDKCQIREMLLFDNSLKIEYGFKQTGSVFGVILNTTSRKLLLKTSSLWELYDLIGTIEEAIQNCAYIQENRFSSFAPQRVQLSYCKAYVDGDEYYSDLYDALLLAKKEVFITDWWLSPELYLKRPVNDKGLNQNTRLDRVLTSLGQKGVKIYIIVYKEVTFVLPLDSSHTKSHLEKLSDNISVLQHPSDLICWWSHHEKVVIIDQEVAFLGGLDLCFGRMDNINHKLLDLEKNDGEVYWPGIDYSNCRIMDFKNVKNHEKPLISRETTPRMPWHDSAIQVVGIPVKDLSRHFIQYWNYAKIDLADRTSKKFLEKEEKLKKKALSSKIFKYEKSGKNERNNEKLENNEKFNDHKKTPKKKVIEVNKLLSSSSGDKYTRVYAPHSDRKNHARINENENSHNKNEEDEMNWDLECDELKLPIDLHTKRYTKENILIQQNAYNKVHKTTSSIYSISPLSIESRKPKKSMTSRLDLDEFRARSPIKTLTLKQTNHQNITQDFLNLYECMDKTKQDFVDYEHDLEDYRESYKKMIRLSLVAGNAKEKLGKIPLVDHFYEENMLQLNYGSSEDNKLNHYKGNSPTCQCQIVRSASNWSCGLAPNLYENSIQFAYIQLIEDSKYYIYIENQFFISSLAGPSVRNNIAKALLFRIKKAHINQELFKIYIIMPLLPGFEGDIADKASSVMRIQLHWEYFTISRSGTSLINSLEKDGIDPHKYLVFLGLRNHAFLKKPVTEIVYVHSKMMIVDDRFVILGSANINDRSMCGNRDSELGVI